MGAVPEGNCQNGTREEPPTQLGSGQGAQPFPSQSPHCARQGGAGWLPPPPGVLLTPLLVQLQTTRRTAFSFGEARAGRLAHFHTAGVTWSRSQPFVASAGSDVKGNSVVYVPRLVRVTEHRLEGLVAQKRQHNV